MKIIEILKENGMTLHDASVDWGIELSMMTGIAYGHIIPKSEIQEIISAYLGIPKEIMF